MQVFSSRTTPDVHEAKPENKSVSNSPHIELRHTASLTTLSQHHRDLFDRLLVAKAIVKEISLVSNEAALDAYPI